MVKSFTVLLVLIFLSLSSACLPQPVRVEGTAMFPTLKDGDKIIIDRNFKELKRGDIISFLYPKDTSKWYIKRIVGLPDEKIEIREGIIFINGEKLDEPYLYEAGNQTKGSFPPQRIPVNHYFVIGDNRDNSSDSRYWGTVSRDLVTGKYVSTYAAATNSK